MYKSLLRKNRIHSTALESLKGALSCYNFFSCSYETVSISAGGVFSQHAPTKAQASNTLCPMIHRYIPPHGGNEWGKGSWVKAWPWLCHTDWQSLVEVQRGILVEQVGEQLCESWTPRMSCRLSIFSAPAQVSHGDRMNSEYMSASAVLSDGCVVLQWRGSLSCERKAHPYQQRWRRLWIGLGMKGEREKEWEREAIQSMIPSFIVCPLRFEYAHSKQMRKMLQTLALLAFSLSPFFYLQLNAFQTEQLYREHSDKKEFHCL